MKQNVNGRQADRRVKARFSPDPQKILKVLPLYCIPLTALLLALVLWKYTLMAEQDLIALKSSEQIKVRFNKQMLLVEIEAILGDLNQAKEMRALKRFIASSHPGDRTEVDRMFLLFSQHKGIYDQVRYIDKSGAEIVRINYRNGDPSIVPRNQLQDKGDRYYFKETLRLRNGRFFLSRFDLNMENGKIERPINPVFRIGTPVVNNEGVKKGILILNVRGQILLDRLGEALANEHHPTWLLDRHGYWLYSEKMDQNWGFMYADGKDKTFQYRFPDEWKRVSNSDEGQFRTDAGLFTYVKVYPLSRSGDLHQMGGPEQGSFQRPSHYNPYYWILLSHVTPSVLAQRTAEMRRITSVLCALAALFSVIISWFYVRNKIVWGLNRAIVDDVARLNESLIASSSVISEHADYTDTLKEALSSARRLSDARYGILSLVKDGETKDFFVDGFTDEEQRNIGREAQAGGWVAKVISEKKPYRLPDISRTPESIGFPPGYPRMNTFLGVPLIHRDEVLGGLYLAEKEGGRSFTERDEDIIVMLADHIAVVVKKTAMYEELKLGASIFSNSIEGITVTDTSGTIVKVNNAFSAITGYSAEEAIGRNPRILKSDRHHPEFYEAMWRSIERDGKWEGEIWNRRRNGETYPEWMSISAIKNNKGQTRHYVAVFHDISQVKKSQEKLEYQANHDALTGLPNRQLYQDRLSMALARAKRNGRKLAVLFLDLDSFKNINDTLGHRAGDLLLQGVADRFAGCCREEDTIARLGGDEFVILMSDLEDGGQGAVGLARRIIASLAKPFQISGNEVLVRASIGITLFPDDGHSPEDLVKYADMAMYKAKKEGKNRYALFHFSECVTEAVKGRLSPPNDQKRLRGDRS